LEAVEAMAQRLVDRSSDPLNAAVRKDLEELVRTGRNHAEELISDAESASTASSITRSCVR
jgi:hypothetical protein